MPHIPTPRHRGSGAAAARRSCHSPAWANAGAGRSDPQFSRMTDRSSPRNSLRLYEIVRDVLRRNIDAAILPTGLVLLEGPIAEIFEISRAPVQRALQMLET
jgi:hypothetical protein